MFIVMTKPNGSIIQRQDWPAIYETGDKPPEGPV